MIAGWSKFFFGEKKINVVNDLTLREKNRHFLEKVKQMIELEGSFFWHLGTFLLKILKLLFLIMRMMLARDSGMDNKLERFVLRNVTSHFPGSQPINHFSGGSKIIWFDSTSEIKSILIILLKIGLACHYFISTIN